MGALRALSRPLRGVICYLLSVIEAASRRYLLSVICYRLSGPLRGVICYLLSVIWAAARRYRLSVICYRGRCAALSVIGYRLSGARSGALRVLSGPLRGVIGYLLSGFPLFPLTINR